MDDMQVLRTSIGVKLLFITIVMLFGVGFFCSFAEFLKTGERGDFATAAAFFAFVLMSGGCLYWAFVARVRFNFDYFEYFNGFFKPKRIYFCDVLSAELVRNGRYGSVVRVEFKSGGKKRRFSFDAGFHDIESLLLMMSKSAESEDERQKEERLQKILKAREAFLAEKTAEK